MAGRALKRKVAINLALTALAGALVILVVLEPGKEPPAAPPKLTDLAQADVTHVTIEQPGQPTVVLERANRGWRMTAPRALRASAGKIDGLLGILSAASHRRYALTAVDPAEMGLAEPEATLRLDDQPLVFGGTDPIEGRRYVLLNDTVHLVGGRHLSRLRNDPLYWADNALLPEDTTITALELPDVTLRRDDKGLWHVEPEPAELSADAPVRLVKAWQRASALSVREAPEALPEDAKPITVRIKGRNEPIVFQLTEMKTGFELIRKDLGIRYTMTGPKRAELLEFGTRKPGTAADDAPPAAGEPPPGG